MAEPPLADPPYDVDYSFLADQEVLVVRSHGTMPSSEWAAITLRATQEGDRHSCRRFLFDHRDAKFRLRFADLWSLPHNIGAFKLPDGARVALLMKPPYGMEKQFIEAFNRNRGFDLKVFDDESDAFAWLVEPERHQNPLAF